MGVFLWRIYVAPSSKKTNMWGGGWRGRGTRNSAKLSWFHHLNNLCPLSTHLIPRSSESTYLEFEQFFLKCFARVYLYVLSFGIWTHLCSFLVLVAWKVQYDGMKWNEIEVCFCHVNSPSDLRGLSKNMSEKV